MKRANDQPQFLRISWWDRDEEWEAMLCLGHRQEVARQHESARGSGELGEACDFCLGRGPRLTVRAGGS
jgi:hypothetical protein